MVGTSEALQTLNHSKSLDLSPWPLFLGDTSFRSQSNSSILNQQQEGARDFPHSLPKNMQKNICRLYAHEIVKQ